MSNVSTAPRISPDSVNFPNTKSYASGPLPLLTAGLKLVPAFQQTSGSPAGTSSNPSAFTVKSLMIYNPTGGALTYNLYLPLVGVAAGSSNQIFASASLAAGASIDAMASFGGNQLSLPPGNDFWCIGSGTGLIANCVYTQEV